LQTANLIAVSPDDSSNIPTHAVTDSRDRIGSHKNSGKLGACYHRIQAHVGGSKSGAGAEQTSQPARRRERENVCSGPRDSIATGLMRDSTVRQ